MGFRSGQWGAKMLSVRCAYLEHCLSSAAGWCPLQCGVSHRLVRATRVQHQTFSSKSNQNISNCPVIFLVSPFWFLLKLGPMIPWSLNAHHTVTLMLWMGLWPTKPGGYCNTNSVDGLLTHKAGWVSHLLPLGLIACWQHHKGESGFHLWTKHGWSNLV